MSIGREFFLFLQNAFLFDGTIKDNFNKYYEAIEKPLLSDEDISKYLSICCADFPVDNECKNLFEGEKQRAFTSIYLSCATDVIMLDEPASAFDEKKAIKMFADKCINLGGKDE